MRVSHLRAPHALRVAKDRVHDLHNHLNVRLLERKCQLLGHLAHIAPQQNFDRARRLHAELMLAAQATHATHSHHLNEQHHAARVRSGLRKQRAEVADIDAFRVNQAR